MYLAPSDKQLNFVAKLVKERDLALLSPKDRADAESVDLLDRREVSKLIDVLLKAPKVTVLAKKTPYQKPLEVGMYHTNTGEILRVYLGQHSGQPLVKRVVLSGEKYEYEYVGSAHRVLRGESVLGGVVCERMSLDEAKNWGRMTGHCIVCGRQLDDPESVDKGIGPVCEKNWG